MRRPTTLLAALACAAASLAGCGRAEPEPSPRAVAKYGVPEEAGGRTIHVTVGTPVGAGAPSQAPGPAPTRITPAPAPGPAKAGKYAVVEVKDGGKVVGVARIKTAVDLSSRQVPIVKDVEKCGHGASMASERLVYDAATRGLKNCVVYLEEIAQGKAWTGPMAEKQRLAVIDQRGCVYDPHVSIVREQTQLGFLNSDTAEHNIQAFRDRLDKMIFNFATGAKTKNLDAGDAFLRRAGMYMLRCNIHPWMNATVFAVGHPYYAVTDEQGRYSLEDVPPGTYTLVCWHEGTKATPVMSPTGDLAGYNYTGDVVTKQQVTVTAGGEVSADFELELP